MSQTDQLSSGLEHVSRAVFWSRELGGQFGCVEAEELPRVMTPGSGRACPGGNTGTSEMQLQAWLPLQVCHT